MTSLATSAAQEVSSELIFGEKIVKFTCLKMTSKNFYAVLFFTIGNSNPLKLQWDRTAMGGPPLHIQNTILQCTD